MKKYLMTAAVFSLFFIGCSKVSTTPDTEATAARTGTTSNNSSVEFVFKPAPQDGTLDQGTKEIKCFTITNMEKANGLVEYKFSYTDGQDVVQTQSLSFGQSLSFSSRSPKVITNFDYFLIEGGGNCGPRRSILPPGPCDYYIIKNPTGPVGVKLIYEYLDCGGTYTQGILLPQSSILISAVPGTVSCPGGVVGPAR